MDNESTPLPVLLSISVISIAECKIFTSKIGSYQKRKKGNKGK